MAIVSHMIRPATLEQDLGYNCHRLSQLVREEMLAQIRQIDAEVTPEQWHLMLCLASTSQGLKPSELAQSGLRDKTTISRMLDVMQKHDLIERVPLPDDGRSYRVRLTMKSRQFMDRANETGALFSGGRIFAALSDAERELMLALLHKCRRGLGDL